MMKGNMVEAAAIGIGVLLGVVSGSFAGASVWRLRARQLVQDDARFQELEQKKKMSENEKLEHTELIATQKERTAERRKLKPLENTTIRKDRSRCLACHHPLAWYDLIPLGSWLSTGGRCRYCHKRIGAFEPLMELGTALLGGLFAWFWVSQYADASLVLLGCWVIILVLMVIAFAYDAKWFLLPDVIMLPMIGLGAVVATFRVLQSPSAGEALLSTLGAVVILSGLYLILWLISRGAWIGFGDVKLGLVLGLLLGEWELALLALFLANFIGLVVVLPGLASGRLSRRAHVPFGPFLIIGFFIALFWGNELLQLYSKSALLFADWLMTLMV